MFRRIPVAAVLLLLITLAGFLLRCWSASLDPFLNIWDERFHALVAARMMDAPLVPMLHRDAVIPLDYTNWTNNGVWLHKPPLFLWQMAAAMKVFGVSEFSARIPSILLGTASIPMMYRLGFWFSGQARVGLAAALLQCCCYYLLQLTNGFYGMDHNDVTMNFWVIASFWAYSHWDTGNDRRRWIPAVVTGLFAGAAILTKWLPGILVFCTWGLNCAIAALRADSRKRTITSFLYLGMAVLVCGITMAPWQLYIFSQFPREAAYEARFAARHLTESIEGHRGDVDFYWLNFPLFFGAVTWTLMPVSVVYFLGKNLQRWRSNQGALVVSLIAVFLFYTLLVQTKVVSYLVIVVPFGLITIAALISEFAAGFKRNGIVFWSGALLCAFLALQHVEILKTHRPDKKEWQAQATNTAVYKKLSSLMNPQQRLVLNAPYMEHVLVMFYNTGVDAYQYCPSEAELQEVFRQKAPIAVFEARPGYDIPDYIRQYPGTTIIPVVLQ